MFFVKFYMAWNEKLIESNRFLRGVRDFDTKIKRSMKFHPERMKPSFALKVWREFRFSMLIEVAVLYGIILGLAFLLSEFLPVTNWSITTYGSNLIFAPVSAGLESSEVIFHILSILFFIVLFFFLPFLANWEEELFRRKRHKWKPLVIQALVFGPVHLFSGSSIATCVAIIFGGLFLGYKYRVAFLKEMKKTDNNNQQSEDRGVLTSTAYHSMYNSLAFLIGLIGLLI